MSAFAVAHPQISCIASLLWRSPATLDLLLLFVAISATIFVYALGWCVFVCFFLKNEVCTVVCAAAQRHVLPAITAYKRKRFFIAMALTSQNRCVTLHVTDLRRTFKIGRR
ncbi:hypothetical protein, partial [Pseudomonas syringae group genomosp. 3]|uniref:hypothetical protein n=1 Tax=Pseudomonas syringae group genomosp. 3 TaxID=251701 RepID=UPI000F00A58A